MFLSVWALQAVEAYSSRGLTSALYAMDLHFGGAACRVLCMSPSACRAFAAMSEQCSFQFSFESIMTPRYFQESLDARGTLLMVYENLLMLILWVMVST